MASLVEAGPEDTGQLLFEPSYPAPHDSQNSIALAIRPGMWMVVQKLEACYRHGWLLYILCGNEQATLDLLDATLVLLDATLSVIFWTLRWVV